LCGGSLEEIAASGVDLFGEFLVVILGRDPWSRS
jgi:hypothetical protein